MELWDGYLKNGTLANVDLVRGEPIPDGLYHLVCEVLVRHTDGSWLLMKRDPSKPNFGVYYEATAGGSALKGEGRDACARRELLEETGISCDSLTPIGQFTSHNTHYFNYLCVTDCDKTSVTLQEGETSEYRWVTEEEFISFVNSEQMIPSQKIRYSGYLTQMGYLTE